MSNRVIPRVPVIVPGDIRSASSSAGTELWKVMEPSGEMVGMRRSSSSSGIALGVSFGGGSCKI